MYILLMLLKSSPSCKKNCVSECYYSFLSLSRAETFLPPMYRNSPGIDKEVEEVSYVAISSIYTSQIQRKKNEKVHILR